MKIVAGLGNPGSEYEKTKHNVGFMFIDAMAEKLGVSEWRDKFEAKIAETRIGSEKVLLVKPMTYMNLSGEAVRAMVDYYKIDPETELLVIFDDISLAPGNIRIRKKGSAGGHNGIKSIITHLGTQNFQRIKVGVGEKPKNWDLADYVLGAFSKDDRKLVDEALERSAKAAALIVQGEIDEAMNLYNKKLMNDAENEAVK